MSKAGGLEEEKLRFKAQPVGPKGTALKSLPEAPGMLLSCTATSQQSPLGSNPSVRTSSQQRMEWLLDTQAHKEALQPGEEDCAFSEACQNADLGAVEKACDAALEAEMQPGQWGPQDTRLRSVQAPSTYTVATTKTEAPH